MEDEIPEGYVRISHILSPYSKYDEIPEDVLKKAADRGTMIHKLCELHMKGEYVPPPLEHQGYFDSFCLWYDGMSLVLNDLKIEQRLNNALLRISGRYDFAAKLGPECNHTIFDIKTSSSTQRLWGPQLAAYKWLFNKDLPNILTQHAERRIVLHLQKDGKIAKVIEYLDHEKDFKIFMNCYENHRYFNG